MSPSLRSAAPLQYQITILHTLYMTFYNLGRCADNQNGNLRWYLPLLTGKEDVISDKELNVFEHFSLQRQGGMQAHRRSKYTFKVCNIIIWCCKDAALRKLGLNFRPLKDKECED